MATTIRTNTAAPQAQPESLLGRGWRALKETISPPPPPARQVAGPDRYIKGAPVSKAKEVRLGSLSAGHGAEGPTVRRAMFATDKDHALNILNDPTFTNDLESYMGGSPARRA